MLSGPNVLLALLGSMGVLVAVLSGLALPHYPILPQARREGFRERLQRKLDQADFQLEAMDFLRVTLILAIGLGIVAYVLTGIPTAAFIGAIGAVVGYWTFLQDRRERRRREYQEALADAVDVLQEAVSTRQSLNSSLAVVAKHCSVAVRGDFEEIVARITAGEEIANALRLIAQRRRDVMCDRFAEALIAYSTEGGKLLPILQALSEAVRGLAAVRRRVATTQSRIRWEARVVCLAPFVFIIILRFTAPDLQGPFYSTVWGQLALIVIACMCGGAYYLMNRMGAKALDPIESINTVA
ncbi:MAG: type II secretion system F family protein [Anaerolineae bacterium]|nr:type II secretion system F family protein [Anaerolineae bacterium]